MHHDVQARKCVLGYCSSSPRSPPVARMIEFLSCIPRIDHLYFAAIEVRDVTSSDCGAGGFCDGGNLCVEMRDRKPCSAALSSNASVGICSVAAKAKDAIAECLLEHRLSGGLDGGPPFAGRKEQDPMQHLGLRDAGRVKACYGLLGYPPHHALRGRC